MHLADLKSYLAADQRLVDLYADPQGWARMAILNIASSGEFSSDRTIAQYASGIWGAKPVSGAGNPARHPDGSRQLRLSEAGGDEEQLMISPLAGKPAPKSMLIDIADLDRQFHDRTPDVADPTQLVSFGTSGHRGTPFNGTFTEAHILAITQAICEYRKGARDFRSALHGQGHPCGFEPGAARGPGSAGGQ